MSAGTPTAGTRTVHATCSLGCPPGCGVVAAVNHATDHVVRAALVFATLMLAAGVLHAQDETATLHVSANLVEVSAVVTDTNGEPRTGLTRDDFVLRQDGKEQPIRYFSHGEELPLTFIVMIDTSGSQRTFLDDEQRACDVFFETVLGRPQDHAALVEVNARITARSELTSDPNRLHLALSALHFDRENSVATRLNDAIYTLSRDVLAKVHGRKAIILISDGGDQGSVVRSADAMAEAQHDNVPVYAVSYSAWSGLDMMPKGGIGGLAGVDLAAGNRDPGLAAMKQWSTMTGGQVYEVARGSTLKQIFENIGAELRSQYEIGYILPADTKPKVFHKLEVKAKDKSLHVQARTGFSTQAEAPPVP